VAQTAIRTPRPCSVCGSPRLCRRRERCLIGARFGRWREERFGRARCLTLRYSVLLSVWVDPSAEHMHPHIFISVLARRRCAVSGQPEPLTSTQGYGLTLNPSQWPSVASAPYMSNTRSEEYNAVLYSYVACFMNTLTLNMYVFLSKTGLTRRNTLFIFVWLRPRNT